MKELATDLQDVRAKIENGKIKRGLIVLHEKASQDSLIEKVLYQQQHYSGFGKIVFFIGSILSLALCFPSSPAGVTVCRDFRLASIAP